MEKFQAYLNVSALYKSRRRAAESTDGTQAFLFHLRFLNALYLAM